MFCITLVAVCFPVFFDIYVVNVLIRCLAQLFNICHDVLHAKGDIALMKPVPLSIFSEEPLNKLRPGAQQNLDFWKICPCRWQPRVALASQPAGKTPRVCKAPF